MKCSDPVLCYTHENTRVIRNFSYVKENLLLYKFKPLSGCGKCPNCLKRRSRELAMKCVLHSSLYVHSCFVTLTYDEKKPTYHNNFEYPDIQKFKKILRQHVNTTEYCHIKTRKLKRRRVPKWLYKKIEIFNVHEYGHNGKKHWHLIVFNHNFDDRVYKSSRNGNDYYISDELSKLWAHGIHTIGNVSEASAMYQAQYTQKDVKNKNTTNGKKSHSKHSGIGKPYFLQHYKQILNLGYVPFQGKKIPVPRSFEKIADRHWSHFYDPSRFVDTKERKAIHRPFKKDYPNKDLADIYTRYINKKRMKIEELTEEWDLLVFNYIQTKAKPDFVKSGENALYDLMNRTNNQQF